MKDALAKPKAWLIVAIVGILVILLLGWFLLVSPQLSNVSTLTAETETAQMQTQTLRAREAALTKQKEELPALEARLRELYELLPNDAEVADLIRQIETANQAAQMRVLDFTVDPPAAVTLPEALTAPPAGATDADGAPAAEGEDAAAGDAAAAAPAGPAEPALSYSTVSMSLDAAPFGQVINYLNSLENLDRAFLITSANITNADAGRVTLQLTGRIYIRPPTAEEQAAAAAEEEPQDADQGTSAP